MMHSRETILKTIHANKPALVELPLVAIDDVIQYEDDVVQFKQALQGNGAAVIEIDDLAFLKQDLAMEKVNGHFIINTIPAIGEVPDNISSLSAQELAPLFKTYVKGTIGVAENGAVWVYEHQMCHRLLPFICECLVLVIEKAAIVPTMHHAFEKINIGTEGFGVFIAGPSKTADIEQSLVIGAHGPMSLHVVIIGKE